MLENYSDVLDIEDIMDVLKIGRNSAYKLINSGEIKSIRVGRKIRIPKGFLLDYLYGKYYTDDSNMLCAPMSTGKGA